MNENSQRFDLLIAGQGRVMHSNLDYLVVDDDPLVLSALERLIQARGNVVRSVSTVADALVEVARRVPHVIIADFDLSPGGNGAELLRIVAQHHPFVRRILFSGSSDSTIEELLEMGIAHGFVPKGSGSGELFAVVNESIERRSAEVLSEAVVISEKALEFIASLGEVVGESRGFLESSMVPFAAGRLLDWARLRLSAASHLSLASDVMRVVASELGRVQVEHCAACAGKGCEECHRLGEVLRLLTRENAAGPRQFVATSCRAKAATVYSGRTRVGWRWKFCGVGVGE